MFNIFVEIKIFFFFFRILGWIQNIQHLFEKINLSQHYKSLVSLLINFNPSWITLKHTDPKLLNGSEHAFTVHREHVTSKSSQSNALKYVKRKYVCIIDTLLTSSIIFNLFIFPRSMLHRIPWRTYVWLPYSISSHLMWSTFVFRLWIGSGECDCLHLQDWLREAWQIESCFMLQTGWSYPASRLYQKVKSCLNGFHALCRQGLSTKHLLNSHSNNSRRNL